MNRFESEFGDDGLGIGRVHKQGNMRAFGAFYRFMDRTWGITVWARDWDDARDYCKRHGLKLDGEIFEVMEA